MLETTNPDLKNCSNISPEAPFVVCEATGGYERALLELLPGSAIAVSLVNPARVRAFATSKGIKAKTDSFEAAPLMPQSTLSPKGCGRASKVAALVSRSRAGQPATGETALRCIDSAAHHRTFPLIRHPLRG